MRVATGIRHELRRGDFFTINLRQTIDRLRQMGEVVVRFAVPLGIHVRIAQPVIGTQVDHTHSAIEQQRQYLAASAVWQAAKSALHAPGHQLVGIERLAAQIEPAEQARVLLRHQRCVRFARSHGHDLRLGVAQQNLHQFDGGVSGTAQNRNRNHGSRKSGVKKAESLLLIYARGAAFECRSARWAGVRDLRPGGQGLGEQKNRRKTDIFGHFRPLQG